VSASLIVWPVVLLSQTAAGAAGEGMPPDAVKVLSIWDFIVKGGPVMIPLGACSLVALTIILERVVSLRRRRVIPPGFLAGLRRILGDGTAGREEALEYCQADRSSMAMILAAGVRHLGASRDWVEKCLQDAGQREVLRLRKYLRGLAVVVSVSPMLGLLGTVTGMVRSFQTVASSGEALGKAELLATGIYEALITTVAGLTIAIPVLIAFHWFSARIERFAGEMDYMAAEFLGQYAPRQMASDDLRPRLKRLRGDDERPAEEEVEAAVPA